MKNRNRLRGRVAALAIIVALAAAGGVHADDGDGDGAPIVLDADEAEIDNARGVSIYTGNVVLTRGPRQVTGDRMTVHLRADDQLDHVVVEGEPAVYTQEGSAERRPVRGEAPRMEYHADGPERVIMFAGARVTQGRNTFTGERIDYEVVADVVRARGEPDTGRRTQITIFPDDEDDDE